MERQLTKEPCAPGSGPRFEETSRPLEERRHRNGIFAKIFAALALASAPIVVASDANAHPHGVEAYNEGWTDAVDGPPSGGLALIERGDTGTFYANKEAKRIRGYPKGGYDIGPGDPLEITAFSERNTYIQLVLLPIIDVKLDPKKSADRLTHGPMNFRIYVDDNREPLHLPTDSDVRYLKPSGSFLTPTKGKAPWGVWSTELHLENIRLGPGKHRVLVESDGTHSYRVMVLGMRATEEATGDKSYMPSHIGPFPCEVVGLVFKDGTGGKKTGGFKPLVDREPIGTPQDVAVNVYLTRGVDAFKPRDEKARKESTARRKNGRIIMKTTKKIMPRAPHDPSNIQQCDFVSEEPPAHSTNEDPRRRNIEVEIEDTGFAKNTPKGYISRFYGDVLYVWGSTERGEIEAFKGKVPEGFKKGNVRLERY